MNVEPPETLVMIESIVYKSNGFAIYWVNFSEKELYVYQPKTKTNWIIQLGKLVGCVVPRKSGGVVLALQNDLAGLDLKTENLTYIVTPKIHPPSNRFNDGKCAPGGRFLAGTMAINESLGIGSLYSVEQNLRVKQLLVGLSISNVMGWSPDYSTRYFIDSPTKQVVAFDYELNTGHISNHRVVVRIPERYFDGMTTDQKGRIWITLWVGFKVTRWNPKAGKWLQSIFVPTPNVTSCTFGWPNMNELYITTARKDMDRTALDKYPKAGSAFRLKTDVIRIKNFEFVG